MHRPNQIHPNLYLEALRKQADAWHELIAAFENSWSRSFGQDWRVDPAISVEEVVADLSYGRD